MIFGARLLEIRKKRKTSQDQLAKAIGVHSPVIGRYERDEVKPSIEVANKLAIALGVSLDYLVGNTDLLIDKELLDKVIDIQRLNGKDKEHVIFTIDAILRDAKTRKAYSQL